jgi:hypothetical protein
VANVSGDAMQASDVIRDIEDALTVRPARARLKVDERSNCGRGGKNAHEAGDLNGQPFGWVGNVQGKQRHLLGEW